MMLAVKAVNRGGDPSVVALRLGLLPLQAVDLQLHVIAMWKLGFTRAFDEKAAKARMGMRPVRSAYRENLRIGAGGGPPGGLDRPRGGRISCSGLPCFHTETLFWAPRREERVAGGKQGSVGCRPQGG
jgi:hypothetical protein